MHLALIRNRSDSPSVFDEDALDSYVLEDGGAGVARALCHRYRHINGINLPVLRHPKSANKTVDVERRPALFEFFWSQHLNG